jgi:hypothetical protein
VDVDGFAAQHRGERREVLAQVRCRPIEGDSPESLHDDLVREPNAQGQSTADGVLDRARLGRQHRGVAGLDRHDGRTEVDVGHLTTDHRERRQGVGSEYL